ncbi:MAG TPA: cyclic nucleotide-binding domain-containing protein [Devosia sp.]|nr:cyclic nucleotide-binding domain-containing protein [Devosia sp.]
MSSLLALTMSLPVRALAAGEALIQSGEAGGEMYVLETGRLSVEREGVEIATIEEPGALVGEMSVLLGIDHSATVRAIGPARVRVVENALAFLERTPLVALHVATLACARLDATSALLAELKKEHGGKTEQGMLARIFGALNAPPRGAVARTHE